MQRLILIVLALAFAGASLAGCASASGSPGTVSTPAELVSWHCNVCHDLSRIKLASHDAAGWAATVARMRGKGARLNDAEAKKVVDFLASGGAGGL